MVEKNTSKHSQHGCNWILSSRTIWHHFVHLAAQEKKQTWNFILLPLHKIRRIDGRPEAFISAFAGALMWHLSAALGRHCFHQRKVRLDVCRPSQVFGLFTLFKRRPPRSTLGAADMVAQQFSFWDGRAWGDKSKLWSNLVIWHNKDL